MLPNFGQIIDPTVIWISWNRLLTKTMPGPVNGLFPVEFIHHLATYFPNGFYAKEKIKFFVVYGKGCFHSKCFLGLFINVPFLAISAAFLFMAFCLPLRYSYISRSYSYISRR